MRKTQKAQKEEQGFRTDCGCPRRCITCGDFRDYPGLQDHCGLPQDGKGPMFTIKDPYISVCNRWNPRMSRRKQPANFYDLP